MKRALRAAFLIALSLGPAQLGRRLARRRVVILGYHDPAPEVLDRHLAALATRYSLVPLREAADALAARDLGRLPRNPLVVTLDDAARGNRALLPVFERHAVTPTIFVCTGIAGTSRGFWWTRLDPGERHRAKGLPDAERVRWLAERGLSEAGEAGEREALSAAEMREMASRVDFQPHSRLHPVLTRCDETRARDEIAGSKRDLEELLGGECYAFAYPTGAYGEREMALAAEAGYASAVTTEPGFVTVSTDPLRLPRLFVRDDAPVRELLVRASGVFAALQRAVPRRVWSALQVR